MLHCGVWPEARGRRFLSLVSHSRLTGRPRVRLVRPRGDGSHGTVPGHRGSRGPGSQDGESGPGGGRQRCGQMCGQMCRQMCGQSPRAAPCVSSPLFSRHPVPGGRAPPAGPGRSPPLPPRLPPGTIVKTFNIKVQFIILDPEKHFVRLRSSRCKQSTTGTKPAARRRTPPATGSAAGRQRRDGCPRREGRPLGPLPWCCGGQLQGTGSPRGPATPLSFGSEFPGTGMAWLQAGSSWLAGDGPGARRVPTAHSDPSRCLPAPLHPGARPHATRY